MGIIQDPKPSQASYSNGIHSTQSFKIKENSLRVVDNRTGKEYTIIINRNAVSAMSFKQMTAPATSTAPCDQTEYGIRVYDPGFQNTAVSESTITYNDGLKGHLFYRGYAIGDLVSKRDFTDTQYLLLYGNIPTTEQRKQWQHDLAAIPKPQQSVFSVIQAFPVESPPMAMMIAGLSALQASQKELTPAYMAKDLYLNNPSLVDSQCTTVLANMAHITAFSHCHHAGIKFNDPDPSMSYVENMLWMMNHVDPATGKPNPKYVRCVEKLWILIADHEMTCSTAALLQTASSLPDALSAMISAVSAFYGILHGGALEVAYKNIAEVGSVDNAQAKIDNVKAKKERLFGYGHRIYRVTDPRAVFIKEMLDELKEEVDRDPLLKVALEIDRLAQDDEYFTSRNLKPNADLFATFVYKAMGFPADFILPMTVMSRTQGLMAHWKEAMCKLLGDT
jgi:citrate synthase